MTIDAGMVGERLARAAMRSASGGKPARVLERIARRHQPPDPVEIEPLHRDQAGAEMRLVRRIERAAEQADAHAGGVGGKAAAASSQSRAAGPCRRSSLAGRDHGRDLPRAAHAVFEAGQLLDADRAARVEAAGGDADLGAEAELAAVGELGRGVVQHDGGIDLAQEFLRRGASSVTIESVWCEP